MRAFSLLLHRVNDYTLWAFNPQPELTSRYDRRPGHVPIPGLPAPSPTSSHAPGLEISNLGTILNILDDERRRIVETEDPVRIVSELEELRTALGLFFGELDSETPRAVRALRRRGWSFQRIATASGVTPARVGQLARATLSATTRRAEPPTTT